MYMELYQKRDISGNWLTCLWGLASLKSVRQEDRLDISGKVDAAVLSPKSIGKASRLETQAGLYVTILRQNSFLPGNPELFALKAFNCLDEAYTHYES